MRITAYNFCNKYIIDPCSPKLSTLEKILAVGLSILFAAIAWGMLHIRAKCFVHRGYREDFQQLARDTPKLEYLDQKLYTMRWSSIPCPKKTAISMLYEGSIRYLHANRVGMEDGSKYLCLQAPGTGHYDLFIKLVYEEAAMIVDLTNQADKAKDTIQQPPYLKKRYFPKEIGKTRDFTHFVVTCKASKHFEKMTLYTYDITEKTTGKIKVIKRLHYKEWPDHGAIAADAMRELVKQVHDVPSPLLVHCRGGVGRTGTFITARTLFMLSEQGKLSSLALKAKIRDIILLGRGERGPQFVQEPIQLKSLYQFAKLLK